MLLENKNAIIYGGSGSVGGSVARAFAREGAKVFLADRILAKVQAVAEDAVSDRAVCVSLLMALTLYNSPAEEREA